MEAIKQNKAKTNKGPVSQPTSATTPDPSRRRPRSAFQRLALSLAVAAAVAAGVVRRRGRSKIVS